MGNEWHVVPSLKEKKKAAAGKKEGAARSREERAIPGFDGEALARFDAQWRASNSGSDSAPPSARNGAQNGGLSTSNGAFGGLEVDDSPPPTPRANGGANGAAHDPENGSTRKAPKPKKPKAKKVTTAQAAAGLDGSALARLLQEAEQKYAADERSQLEAVADHLLAAFRDVDIPFNRTVLEQPLSKSAEVPLSDVPSEVQIALAGFLARKGGASLASFAETLVGAVFAAVPESASGAKAAPPKAKVGLLVFLAATLRARPEVLLQLAPALLGSGAAWSTPRRLPFQLWITHQAARSNLGVAAAVWCRVLLPQLLGQELPGAAAAKPAPVPKLGPSAASLAMAYLEQLLALAREGADAVGAQRLGPADGDARGVWALKAADTRLLRAAQAGIRTQGGGEAEPVVPAGALPGIARACFVPEPAFGPVAARIRLTQLYEELRELQLAGVAAGVAPAHESARLALETATAAAEASPANEELVEQAARTLVDLLAVEPSGAAAAWEARHKQQIRGSAAVLAHLQQRPPGLQQLLCNLHRRGAFLALLRELRVRHRSLREHGKSWQQKAAASAEASCAALADGARRGARNSALANALLLAIFLAALAFALSRQQPVRELGARLQATALGQQATHAAQQAGERLQPAADWLQGQAGELTARVRPLVAAGTERAVELLQPLLREVEAAARPLARRLYEHQQLLHKLPPHAAAYISRVARDT